MHHGFCVTEKVLGTGLGFSYGPASTALVTRSNFYAPWWGLSSLSQNRLNVRLQSYAGQSASVIDRTSYIRHGYAKTSTTGRTWQTLAIHVREDPDSSANALVTVKINNVTSIDEAPIANFNPDNSWKMLFWGDSLAGVTGDIAIQELQIDAWDTPLAGSGLIYMNVTGLGPVAATQFYFLDGLISSMK
eukprot:tig00021234_g19428.t1